MADNSQKIIYWLYFLLVVLYLFLTYFSSQLSLLYSCKMKNNYQTSFNQDLFKITNRKELNTSDDCQKGEIIEQQSESFKKKIARNCQLFPQPKKVDWNVFEKNRSDYVERVFYNPAHVWWSNLAVFTDFNAIYTIIFKAGSKELIRYLTKVNGYTAVKFPHEELYKGLFKPSMYMLGKAESSREAKNIFDNSFKFVYYRDPLERLYSGYNDKVTKEYPMSCSYIPWLNLFKEFLSKRQKEPSFKLFLEYLDTLNDSSMFDHHFRPQVLLAHPCEIQYNYVALTENIRCSLPYLLKNLNTSKHIPPIDKSSSKRDINSIINGMEDLALRVMKKHYKDDYDILGFQLPNIPH